LYEMSEYVKYNDVRAVLAKSGIRPESLPPEEDLKTLERRVKSDEKRLRNAGYSPADDILDINDGTEKDSN
jgi:DNA-damage-inducible protein D